MRGSFFLFLTSLCRAVMDNFSDQLFLLVIYCRLFVNEVIKDTMDSSRAAIEATSVAV